VPPTPAINVPLGDIRTDLPMPVLAVADEWTNINLYEGVTLHAEPDTGTFHVWEIAGMTHFDPIIGGYADILKSLPDTPDPFGGCTIPPPNPGIPGEYALRAAVHALTQWAQSGVAPVSAPRFQLQAYEVSGYTVIYRDPATRIALGGIRLPPVAAPIATISGYRPGGADATCAPEAGAYDPWDGDIDPWDGIPGLDPSPTPEPSLQALYPTHEDYVNTVSASANKAAASGFMLPADAAAAIAQAKSSSVP
jgi:Alpha/beta hydrolase domain